MRWGFRKIVRINKGVVSPNNNQLIFVKVTVYREVRNGVVGIIYMKEVRLN